MNEAPGQARHIVILGERFNFPRGMAGTSRVRLLARGLVEDGGRTVTVLPTCSLDPWDKPMNTEARGEADGVAFEYTSGGPIRSRHFLVRRWQDLRGVLVAAWRLRQMRRAGRLDLVVLYTHDFATVRWATFCCRWLGLPVVQELCEWPLDLMVGHEENRRALRDARKFCEKALDLVQAALPISEALERHVLDHAEAAGHDIPLLRVPILVDAKRFAPSSRLESSDELYFFCSTSLIYREIVRLLAQTARLLKAEGLRFSIRFSGEASEDEIEYLKAQAAEAGVSDEIEYLGFISADELKRQYQGAALLLAPLPNDAKSLTRFPTKLGEYLACERPVVATRVGEIEKHLEDGVSAFLAAESTPDSLATKIREALEDPTRAARVARAGRRLAETEFDYAAQGKRLGAFFDRLLEPASTEEPNADDLRRER